MLRPASEVRRGETQKGKKTPNEKTRHSRETANREVQRKTQKPDEPVRETKGKQCLIPKNISVEQNQRNRETGPVNPDYTRKPIKVN